MGVLNGTISYLRYFVEGDLPSSPKEFCVDRLQHYAIRPLVPESAEEASHGWASARSLLDTEMTDEKVFHNNYLLATLRVDKWKIPTSLLKAHFIEELRLYKEKNHPNEVSRREKALLKEAVKTELKKRSLPSIVHYDFCWNIDQREVRFWNFSAKTNELFVDLFEKTFRLQLVNLTPYTLAERWNWKEDQLESFEELQQEPFSPFSKKGEH